MASYLEIAIFVFEILKWILTESEKTYAPKLETINETPALAARLRRRLEGLPSLGPLARL